MAPGYARQPRYEEGVSGRRFDGRQRVTGPVIVRRAVCIHVFSRGSRGGGWTLEGVQSPRTQVWARKTVAAAYGLARMSATRLRLVFFRMVLRPWHLSVGRARVSLCPSYPTLSPPFAPHSPQK